MSIVLVVEDDPIINLNIVETLEGVGIETASAFSVSEALSALQARSDISVLLTDVNLHGESDGRALAFEARVLYPAIHIIVASGLSESEVGSLPSDSTYLAKPFSQFQIEATVKAALSR